MDTEQDNSREGTPALWWCGLANEGPMIAQALAAIPEVCFDVDPAPEKTEEDTKIEKASGAVKRELLKRVRPFRVFGFW